MKKILILGMTVFFSAILWACQETTTTTTTTMTSATTTLIDVSNTMVNAYATNNDLSFVGLTTISYWDEPVATNTYVDVDDLTTFQTFYGTGAALTYSAAYAIDQSPSRDEIIQALFSEQGLNIQLVRLTVGASDFVTPEVGHYTYDDTVGNVTDSDLSEFSMAQDEIIFQILEEALDINPNIVFMAAPWSAPAWMKSNKSLNGGALALSNYPVYADYLVKYLTELENRGIHIKYLSVQNEPYYGPYDYPGMIWSIDTTKIFVRDHLGPKIAAAGLSTKIMIWDHNTVDNNGNLIDFPTRVLANEETAAYVGAVGVHCYTGDENDMVDFLDTLREDVPGVEVFMTECTAITTYQNIESNMLWSNQRMYLEAYNHFASGTTYWNMALDPSGSLHLGGCGNCTGLLSIPIDGSSGYEIEADGYLTGHFNKDILSGSKRILVSSTSSAILATGFVDEFGKITLVLSNEGVAKNTTIRWRGHAFSITLPKNATITITWNIPQE
ncbi:MAG: glycoside hydrolase family 30 beta sandwich domain-containing protein [Candidatus Izemoplasmatales bacterium]